MKLGFTGTRDGMTEKQRTKFVSILIERDVTELHHGDCVGADEDAHNIARNLGIDVVIHPPVDAAERAFCMGAVYTHQPRTHFARNRHIVDVTEGLAATPKLMVETEYGGTWMTIRYSRKVRVKMGAIKGAMLAYGAPAPCYPTFIIWPDGTLKLER